MIINIRGTSGSGKSTLVRRVMELYAKHSEVVDKVRDRAVVCGYVCDEPFVREPGLPLPKSVFVAGRYTTATGGCDTLPSLDVTYPLVEKWCAEHAIFEGIMASEEVRRAVELSKRRRLAVIGLTTPLKECLASIQKRRDARGDTRPLNPANTTRRYAVVQRALQRLKSAGVEVHQLDREEAYRLTCELLEAA